MLYWRKSVHFGLNWQANLCHDAKKHFGQRWKESLCQTLRGIFQHQRKTSM